MRSAPLRLLGPRALSFTSLLPLILIAPALAANPPVAYETTVSGYTLDSGRGVAMAPDGSATVIGRMVGETQDSDILIFRVDDIGEVVWIRTIEGAEHDYATDLVIDAAGDVYVSGWTDSADFPLQGGLERTLTGFRDAFVIKLAGQDGSIVFSTLIGGDYVDQGEGIALGTDGDIYLSGGTESTDFPTTPDAYQPEINSPPYAYQDVFVMRLSPDATTIEYSTHLGGSNDDRFAQIALGPNDEIILAGWTESPDFPVVSPLQATFAGGHNDLFVAQLSADGTQLEFSTYLGGEGSDSFSALAVDTAGGIYVTGSTNSVDYPTTPGAFQEGFAGAILGCEIPFGGRFNCDDAFVTKIAPDRGGLAYSTFLAGHLVDEAHDLAVDAHGNAYVVGYTVSEDFPTELEFTSASIFVSRLNAGGSELAYTHLKASGSANAGHGVAVDDAGNLVFTGSAEVPADAYVAELAGGAALSVGIEDDSPGSRPLVAELKATPNPFNPRTTLSFRVDRPGDGSLRIFDARGTLVRTLVAGRLAAGVHEIVWDALDDAGQTASSGVYFAELRAGRQQLVRKLALVR